jgi:hypothetical protein
MNAACFRFSVAGGSATRTPVFEIDERWTPPEGEFVM